jgi:hypothetical protein
MNNLTRTIFGRIYVFSPGQFYKIQDNITYYTEHFKLDNGLYGKFHYEKFKYGIDNKYFKIESNIIIESTKNKDKYVEYYLYKYYNNTYSELHKLDLMNMINPSKSILIESIPKTIMNELYFKTDKNILWSNCRDYRSYNKN